MKGPEESVNQGAVVDFESWRNSLERPSTGQAASFVAARTILIPSWFRSVLLTFKVGEDMVHSRGKPDIGRG